MASAIACKRSTVYHGPYRPLQGVEMTQAYRSVVDISFSVKAGLLIRQTHHWAADVFVVAIVLHLFRVFFTGGYRKPRDLTFLIGVAMLTLVLLEGYLGYSLVDDLLSGMGLAIGYGVALSIPFVGANLAALLWGGAFPGASAFWSRMYIAHVLLLPVAIGGLLIAHLLLVAARHHTQFRQPRRTERRLVGVPAFPGQAPRSLGLALGVAAILVLLGGLVQINPIWLWGPYHVASATNGAQPDWYLGWLIGALRLMPGFDVVVGHYTLVPNPFWGGVLFPAWSSPSSSSGRRSSGGSRTTMRSTTSSTGRATTHGAPPSAPDGDARPARAPRRLGRPRRRALRGRLRGAELGVPRARDRRAADRVRGHVARLPGARRRRADRGDPKHRRGRGARGGVGEATPG